MCEREIIQYAALYYERYYHAMISRALSYLRSKEDAEDVVSDCWLKLLQHLPRLIALDEQARSAYVLRTVQNGAIDHIRKKKRAKTSLYTIVERTAQLQDEIGFESIAMTRNLVSRLLQFLPERERRVILLQIEGYSTSAIAQRMKIAPASVRVYRHRAQQRLAAYTHTVQLLDELDDESGEEEK